MSLCVTVPLSVAGRRTMMSGALRPTGFPFLCRDDGGGTRPGYVRSIFLPQTHAVTCDPELDCGDTCDPIRLALKMHEKSL